MTYGFSVPVRSQSRSKKSRIASGNPYGLYGCDALPSCRFTSTERQCPSPFQSSTWSLMTTSVRRTPRFGRTADGRPLRGSGDKAGPQPDDPCGGCQDFWNGPWDYESTYCASFDTGCLENCAIQCAKAAASCGACYETHNKWACMTCLASAWQCARCGAIPNLCCNDWETACAACAAP